MPNIRQFEIPAGIGITPDSRATAAAEEGGRRISANYRQAASSLGDAASAVTSEGARYGSAIQVAGNEVVKYAEHVERANGAVGFAGIQDKLTKEWNEQATAASKAAAAGLPLDPNLVTRFREETMQPALAKFKESFFTEGGRKWADAHADSFSQHMFTKSTADIGNIAGDGLIAQIKTYGNAVSNTVRNDPSSLDFKLNTLADDVEGFIAPGTPAVTANKVRTEITRTMGENLVKSAFLGLAETNLDAAVKLLNDGRYDAYISGPARAQIEREFRRQERMDKAQDAWDKRVIKEERSEVSKTVRDEIVRDLYSDAPKITSINEIRNNRNLQGPDLEYSLQLFEQRNKADPMAAVSQQTSMSILNRMRFPVDDPRRITSIDSVYDSYLNGKLTKADFNFLVKEFRDLKTPDGVRLLEQKAEFINGVKEEISKSNPMMGISDRSGNHQLYRFRYDLDRKIEEYRKAGKNPYDLMDPSKPDYLGKPEVLKPYQVPIDQSIRNLSKQFRPAPPPAAPVIPKEAPPKKPGESIKQYQDRVAPGPSLPPISR